MSIKEIAERHFLEWLRMREDTPVTPHIERGNGRSLKELSRQFGVAETTVSRIANRQLWSHIA